MWSTFVAAHTDDRERAREARLLAERVFAAALADLDAVEEIAETLFGWAEDLWDHPHHPGEPAPAEADRRTYDHLKELLRDHLPVEFRDWMSRARLSLDVGFSALSRASDQRTRKEAAYLYGRAVMALELGHRQVAQSEWERLRALRNEYDQASDAAP